MIIACVDGSIYSSAVVEYGIEITKRLNNPLMLLNVVRHSHKSSKLDLSGNIGLGAREDLLEELSNEEAKESKTLIHNGKEILKELKEKSLANGVNNLSTMQRHGELFENLVELENEAKLIILGLKGKKSESVEFAVGEQVEKIIKEIKVPIMLINQKFKPIKNVMFAYDGSSSSKKALSKIVNSPMLGDEVIRHIVNVNKNTQKSKTLLNEAKEILKESNILTKFISLSAEPLAELLNYQSENEIDVMVMGAFSHNSLRSALFGSFTLKVLANTKIPLVLLR